MVFFVRVSAVRLTRLHPRKMEALLIMFAPLFRKLLGSKNDRDVKRMYKVVNTINALEEQMVALSDEQLKAKTNEFP